MSGRRGNVLHVRVPEELAAGSAILDGHGAVWTCIADDSGHQAWFTVGTEHPVSVRREPWLLLVTSGEFLVLHDAGPPTRTPAEEAPDVPA